MSHWVQVGEERRGAQGNRDEQRGHGDLRRRKDTRELKGCTDVMKKRCAYPAYSPTGCRIQVSRKPPTSEFMFLLQTAHPRALNLD